MAYGKSGPKTRPLNSLTAWTTIHWRKHLPQQHQQRKTRVAAGAYQSDRLWTRRDLSAAGSYKRPQQPKHLLRWVRSRPGRQAAGSKGPAQAARGRTVASPSWIRVCCCRDVARDTDSVPVLYTSSRHHQQDCWTTDLNMTTAAPQQITNSSHKMLFTDYNSHPHVKQGLDLPRKIKPLSFRRWFFSTYVFLWYDRPFCRPFWILPFWVTLYILYH